MSDFNFLVDVEINTRQVEHELRQSLPIVYGNVENDWNTMHELARKYNYTVTYGVHNRLYAYKFTRNSVD